MEFNREQYGKLHKRYLEVKGNVFDSQDIENAAISYAFNTCGLEGNTITLGETESFLTTDVVVPGKTLNEHLQIKNAHEAFVHMFQFINEGFEMNESLAMTFHKLNTKDWLNEGWQGKYKTISNRVGGRSTPYPAKAKQLFKQLFKDLGNISDPMERAIKLHLDTVIIHPWQDGNGRTARLMMNFELIKNSHGHLQIPKQGKDEYFKAIRQSIEKKSHGPFANYIYKLANQTYKRKIDFLDQKKKARAKEVGLWDYNDKVSIY